MKIRCSLLLRLCSGLCLTLSLLACAEPHFPEASCLRHARYLEMSEQDGATVVRILNPWDSTRLLAHFVLVPESLQAPSSTAQLPVIRTPMRHCAILSTVHAALALRLGAGAYVSGLADAEWAVDSSLRAAHFTPLGSSHPLNVERLAAVGAQAVLSSPFEGDRESEAWHERFTHIPCADYMEATPLARAEWMRFFGRLWACGERADSLFFQEERAYLSLCDSLKHCSSRPRVMLDQPQQGQWYVPAGQSYIASVIHDAGGDYLFANEPSAGSISLSPEAVLARCATQADLWVIRTHEALPPSCAALAQSQALYAQFRALRNRRVFFCNTLRRPYYESLPFSPSLMLREWVAILHPQRRSNYRLQFFERLP